MESPELQHDFFAEASLDAFLDEQHPEDLDFEPQLDGMASTEVISGLMVVPPLDTWALFSVLWAFARRQVPATNAKVKISFFMDLIVFAIIVIKRFEVNAEVAKIVPTGDFWPKAILYAFILVPFSRSVAKYLSRISNPIQHKLSSKASFN